MNAADATRLAEARGTDRLQLLLRLETQLRDRVVVECRRDRLALEPLESLDLGRLPIDVAGVLCLEHHLFDDGGRKASRLLLELLRPVEKFVEARLGSL